MLITLLLGFSAVNTGNNLLFLVVSGLLAFMSVTGLAGVYNITRLTPDIVPPDELYAGIPAPFQLTLINSSRYLPSFLITISTATGQSCLIPVIPPNSIWQGTILMSFPHRGAADIGTLTVSSPYPVGFFTRFWTFAVQRQLVVFATPHSTVVVAGNDDAVISGSTNRNGRGVTGELERIDPYSGSEPLRMIHWKHSARLQELLVKGFGRTAILPITISVDELPAVSLEERLSWATWLVQRWIRERPVGLQCGAVSIPPASGRLHGLQLMKVLALHDQH